MCSSDLFQVDCNRFDLIDLDAYGVPFEQLERIFREARGEIGVHVTFIQSVFGMLPAGFLARLGYPPPMVRKCPALFTRNGQRKMLNYLALNGVREAKIYATENQRKNYIFFRIAAKK